MIEVNGNAVKIVALATGSSADCETHRFVRLHRTESTVLAVGTNGRMLLVADADADADGLAESCNLHPSCVRLMVDEKLGGVPMVEVSPAEGEGTLHHVTAGRRDQLDLQVAQSMHEVDVVRDYPNWPCALRKINEPTELILSRVYLETLLKAAKAAKAANIRFELPAWNGAKRRVTDQIHVHLHGSVADVFGMMMPMDPEESDRPPVVDEVFSLVPDEEE